MLGRANATSGLHFRTACSTLARISAYMRTAFYCCGLMTLQCIPWSNGRTKQSVNLNLIFSNICLPGGLFNLWIKLCGGECGMSLMRKISWVSWHSRCVHGGLHRILMCVRMWTFLSHFCVGSDVGVWTMHIYGSITICLERTGSHLWPALFTRCGLHIDHFMSSFTLKELLCTVSHWTKPVSRHTMHLHFYSNSRCVFEMGNLMLAWILQILLIRNKPIKLMSSVHVHFVVK